MFEKRQNYSLDVPGVSFRARKFSHLRACTLGQSLELSKTTYCFDRQRASTTPCATRCSCRELVNTEFEFTHFKKQIGTFQAAKLMQISLLCDMCAVGDAKRG